MCEYKKESYLDKIRELNVRIQQKEEECKDLQDRFFNLVEHSPLPMMITVNRKIQYSNKAMEVKLGYTQDFLCEKDTRLLYISDAEYNRVGGLIDEHDEFETLVTIMKMDGSTALYKMKFTKNKKENYVSLYLKEV